jgi:hypothetical protein
VSRLTFEDDSRLDVKACAAYAITKRGQGTKLATLAPAAMIPPTMATALPTTAPVTNSCRLRRRPN